MAFDGKKIKVQNPVVELDGDEVCVEMSKREVGGGGFYAASASLGSCFRRACSRGRKRRRNRTPEDLAGCCGETCADRLGR
jgi:hypothetical protein